MRCCSVLCRAIVLLFLGFWLIRPQPPVQAWPLVAPVQAAATPEYHLSDAEVLQRVLGYVRQQYVDPRRVDVWEMLHKGLEQAQRAVPEILAQFDGRQAVTVTIAEASRRFTLGGISTINDLTKVTREIFAFVDLHYHGQTEAKDLEYLVIDGMLNALDPHSALLTPKIYTEFKIGTKGNFGGIGIAIGSKDGQLTVIAPIEGTPAWRAGLKANDRINQIGEESTINMSLTEAVEKLRGRVGTSVALTVERAGKSPFMVTLKRAIIEIDSVQSTLLTEGGKSIGYIKIKSFQENTDSDFQIHLNRLLSQANGTLDGMILDLRNNPGGLLQQAVNIADHFLDAGVIVSTVGANGRFMEQDTAHPSANEVRAPLIVLVNEGSASASEIVAGALQFQRRALIVGAHSFGKGSVQTVYDLRDGSALKLTIAEYLTGGKQSIQTVGVLPDVELLPVTVDKKAMNLIEDKHTYERDLEKHLATEKGPAVTEQRSAHRIRYLIPAEATPSEDEATRREYSKILDRNEFPVQFAQAILNTSLGNESMSAALPRLAQEAQDSQAEKIRTALLGEGIGWGSVAKGKGDPHAQITYQLLSKEGRPLKAVPVGEEAQLSLTAENIGAGHFSELIGSTKADTPFLENKEFVFGNLGPGEKQTWMATFTPPRHMATATIPVTVEFQEANQNRPTSFTAMVPIQGSPRPQFAYSYRFGAPVGSKVRRPGLLPVGKSIPLVLQVKNIGAGPSVETVATIKNVEGKGPFIEVGRVNLGRLAIGATHRATFRIHLEAGFDASTFTMELGIMDGTLLESITNQLEFTVGSGDIRPVAGPWYEGPKIQVAGLTLPLVTGSARQHLSGRVSDDQRVKDLFIFVGDEKVYYQANAKESNAFPLDTDIPLKIGSNLVTIAARDNNDLLSRYTMFILRTVEGNVITKQ